ncbi:hypothetical protein [Winogradskyella sp.]|uniref:hypothetical protein n=1 Tax=Winogradskyella sp. TaxID=1883156 RepID=UPI00260A369D|nr:hypothetical protein [Winogradskyella sp.]
MHQLKAYQHAVHGVNTKTITIPTNADQRKYNLGDFQNDNFGKGSKVIGISARYNSIGLAGDNIRSIQDRPLFNLAEVSQMYLSLMDYSVERYFILQNRNLYYQSRLYLGNPSAQGDIFFSPCEVNWNESVVTIGDNVTVDGTRDIELTVYFTTTCGRPASPTLVLDNGIDYNALRKKTIEVKTSAEIIEYQLGNGSNPLTNKNRLVGLAYNFINPAFTSKGRRVVSLDTFLGASFLTLNVDNRLLTNRIPLGDVQFFNRWSYPYFPIEPTWAKDFDWSECKIFVSDKTLPQDNFSYLIDLFYDYGPDC